MRREEKNAIIDGLTEQINNASHFYLTDISALNAADTSSLRRKCFERNIELVVVKNTLLKRALEKSEGNFKDLYDILKNSTSVMFCETGNSPAKLIKEFRKEHERPLLKAAFVEESIYLGDEQLDALSSLKSKAELIGDVLLLLQSPMKNLLSAMQSGGNNLAGVLQTLADKEEN
ncbi:MAG: 50S ribosomal protein L10 [Bacteroides sp. SM1_62]|nr:MAG: 50S ribosomal protein L10 [Bacteroides sp. SM23_62]KPL23322.1 MAG: 50S ribosomal protein L10 [Bacteroides sp. SM1_62]